MPTSTATPFCRQVETPIRIHTFRESSTRLRPLGVLYRLKRGSTAEEILMKPPRFGPAIGWLQKQFVGVSREIQTKLNFALIGGLSLAAWGRVRATQDIDFLADSEPSPIGNINIRRKLGNYLEHQRCRVEWRVGDYDDPVPLLLRLELPERYGKPSADILWAHKRWQRDALNRSITVRVASYQIRVLHPEDLILLKLEAGGPQDLIDIRELLEDPPPELKLSRLREVAVRLRVDRILERCLRDIRNGS